MTPPRQPRADLRLVEETKGSPSPARGNRAMPRHGATTFGGTIRRLREARGIGQRELAPRPRRLAVLPQ